MIESISQSPEQNKTIDPLAEKRKAKERARSAKYRQEHHEEELVRKRKYYQEHREEVYARQKKYRQEYPEKARVLSAKYYQEHPEKMLASQKKYRQKHHEETRARGLKYYQKNREEVLARHIKYYQKHSEEMLARSRKYRQEHPEKIRDRELKRSYSLTLDDYNTLLAAQNGVCAVCSKPPSGNGDNGKNLHVDHDHKTGKIRGLLCAKCNMAIGLFQESSVLLLSAAEYLICG